jgi:hypothetical protein
MVAVGGPMTRSRLEAFDQTAQVLSDLAVLLRAGGERLRHIVAAYVGQVTAPDGVGTEPEVKEVWDRAGIRRMWDYLTRNGADSPGRSRYDGLTRVLPDGTEIGLRQSDDWGDTLDVWYPDGSYKKIHTPYAPPLISAPPQLPPAGHPALAPLPPQVGNPPVALPPTQVVDPATLPPWLRDPSPPGSRRLRFGTRCAGIALFSLFRRGGIWPRPAMTSSSAG